MRINHPNTIEKIRIGPAAAGPTERPGDRGVLRHQLAEEHRQQRRDDQRQALARCPGPS
jgi:hypothetical protein